MRYGYDDPRTVEMTPVYDTDWLVPEHLVSDPAPCLCEETEIEEITVGWGWARVHVCVDCGTELRRDRPCVSGL